jgi:hypothetical protein
MQDDSVLVPRLDDIDANVAQGSEAFEPAPQTPFVPSDEESADRVVDPQIPDVEGGETLHDHRVGLPAPEKSQRLLAIEGAMRVRAALAG